MVFLNTRLIMMSTVNKEIALDIYTEPCNLYFHKYYLINILVMMCGDVWWCVVMCDGVWWCVVVCNDVWWCVDVYDGVVMYGDVWWCVVMSGDVW